MVPFYKENRELAGKTHGLEAGPLWNLTRLAASSPQEIYFYYLEATQSVIYSLS